MAIIALQVISIHFLVPQVYHLVLFSPSSTKPSGIIIIIIMISHVEMDVDADAAWMSGDLLVSQTLNIGMAAIPIVLVDPQYLALQRQ